MDDQVWETIIHQSESELLQSEQTEEARGPIIDRHATAAQLMSARDIAQFIEVTAQSHGCKPEAISYFYEPITDDDGHILFTELFLVFSMRSLVDGILLDRQIHTIRVIVPQEVQQRARAMLEPLQPSSAQTTSAAVRVARQTAPAIPAAPAQIQTAPTGATISMSARRRRSKGAAVVSRRATKKGGRI